MKALAKKATSYEEYKGMCFRGGNKEARYWSTPMSSDSRGSSGKMKPGKQVQLVDAVRMLPTPTARDWKSGKGKTQQERGRSAGPSLAEVSGGTLNPQWVEWLMDSQAGGPT
jgi:hypothetical protein